MAVALTPVVAIRNVLARALAPFYEEVIRSPSLCLSLLRAHAGTMSAHDDDGMIATPESPVLVLGGFLSHPVYYAPFARILARGGHTVHLDEAINCRRFNSHIDRLCRRVDEIVDRTGKPLRVVGHSLGGLQALALLVRRPAAVGQVIAVASPINGGTPWHPLQRLVERTLRVRVRDAQSLRRRIAPYSRRVTTISSPADSIAPPRVCAIPNAGNVVLSTVTRADRALASHTGMILMPTALRVIRRLLLRPCSALDAVQACTLARAGRSRRPAARPGDRRGPRPPTAAGDRA